MGVKLNGSTSGWVDLSALATGGGVVTSQSAAATPLTVKGAVSQSANLLEVQNSTGTMLARIGNTGTVEARLADMVSNTAGPTTLAAFRNTVNGSNFGIHSPASLGQFMSAAVATDTVMRTESGGLGIGSPSAIYFGSSSAERMRINTVTGTISGSGASLGNWTAFTPGLFGTGWTQGNAVFDCYFANIGRMGFARIKVTFGTTTVFGSVSPTINAPNDGATYTGARMLAAATALLIDTSSGNRYTLAVDISSGGNFIPRVVGTNGLLANMTSTVPFALASTDVLHIAAVYELDLAL
jgi:hypothetical protein